MLVINHIEPVGLIAEEIETLLNEEVKQRFAPKTYDLMKELFKLVEAQND